MAPEHGTAEDRLAHETRAARPRRSRGAGAGDGPGSASAWGGAPPPARRRAEPEALQRPRALRAVGAIDGLAVAVLLACAVVGLGPAWGDASYLLPAVVGGVLGLALAWLGAVRRWPAVTVAAATVVAYLLVGGPLVFPGTTVAGVVPTLDTLHQLTTGAVDVWKSTLTNVPPLGSFPDLLLLPFVLTLLAGVLGATVAWRARHAAWALVPLAAAMTVVILLGTIEAAYPVAQGLVFGVVGLLWASWRATEARLLSRAEVSDAARAASRRLGRHRLRSGVALLAVASALTVLVVPLVLPAQRSALREVVVPPPDLHQYVSPLVAFRHYVKDLKDDDLFTVDGLPAGARVRLATLDTYNGVVYDVSDGEPGSGVYSRAGDRIASDAAGRAATVDVTVDDYSGVWVPDVGAVTGVSYGGADAEALQGSTYYNSTTGTTLATSGLRGGDSYAMHVLVPPAPSDDQLADATIEERDLPRPTNVPDSVGGKTEQFVADETDPVKEALNIRDALVSGGIYSHGLEGQAASRPGHSAERIDELLADDEMVGDDEQFAVAFSLMAQSAGIPARVVMGFVPGDDDWQEGEPFVAQGGDVRAWAEIPVKGYGWVPIDVVPDEDNKVQPEPKSEQVPKPPVLENPEPPEEPESEEAGATNKDTDDDDADSDAFAWGTAAAVAAAVVVPLAVLVGPAAAIVLLKSRRRTRRREAASAVDRFSGGWSEVLDVATDLGGPVPRGATRREGATVLGETFSQVPHGATATLAAGADASVFGGGAVAAEEAAAYWGQVDAVVEGMYGSVRRRDRWRAALSLRSLRRGPAEGREGRPGGRRDRADREAGER
ncbi:transglutaminase-like domain-containing protein [Cellulomonas sp. PhB143]|uniref:transglutaminase-like domain-containing protein n=1 Tax=Cellulomonas sp. PhB143 TaxID=2485186 RepID=UPI000F46217E|nr:transglutaminase-like domain-containing protein [Cellulomonas sp. PhB143]ROS76726.1 transglutaminase superfamily protein [Cellulomonas sp. PhB143]